MFDMLTVKVKLTEAIKNIFLQLLVKKLKLFFIHLKIQLNKTEWLSKKIKNKKDQKYI